MKTKLFHTQQYRSLMQEHISKTIGYLFDQNQEFAIACEVRHIHFSPELPSSIKNNFDHTVLFIVSGFTFESAQLHEGDFTFEAGFGSENFGSVVSVPLLAIKQLFVGDNPIVINFTEPTPLQKKDADKGDESSKQTSKKNSMELLLKNPENKKLLKVKKHS